MKSLIIFITTILITAHAHEGEHAAAYEVSSGIYSYYSDVQMQNFQIEFEYNPPFFKQIGENSRVFICDSEGSICKAKSFICEQDDIIIARNKSFRFLPACGLEARYYGLISE